MLLGMLGSSLGPACIVPDYCILVQAPGTDWCINVEDAHMWPAGPPVFEPKRVIR